MGRHRQENEHISLRFHVSAVRVSILESASAFERDIVKREFCVQSSCGLMADRNPYAHHHAPRGEEGCTLL
jgi:hypothetical protein